MGHQAPWDGMAHAILTARRMPPPQPLRPSPESPVPFGRYELLELMGEGAMAEVFRARQQGPMGFSKEVAIKRLRPRLDRDRRDLESLVNEARLGGQLRHPGLVEIYGCDVVDGQFFLAMELVNGWTLDEVLWQVIEMGQQLPLEAVLDILRQVASALAYAHAAVDDAGKPLRLVHRDLKPQNLFLSNRGVVKIADFGLAKSTANLYQTTDSDTAKGSPLYMSPEQINGSALDGRSDLFAVGSMAIELVTGLRAFEGSSIPNTLMKVLAGDCSEAWGAFQSGAPQLAPAVGRLLQVDRQLRYSDAGELLGDLDELAEDTAMGLDTRALAAALRGERAENVPDDIQEDYEAIREAARVRDHGGQPPPSLPRAGLRSSRRGPPRQGASAPPPAALAERPRSRPEHHATTAPGAARILPAGRPPEARVRSAHVRPVRPGPPPAADAAADESAQWSSESPPHGGRATTALLAVLAVTLVVGALTLTWRVFRPAPRSLAPAPVQEADASSLSEAGLNHVPPKEARPYGDLALIVVGIDSRPRLVQAHYRLAEDRPYRTVALTQSGSRWRRDVPITGGARRVDYWIEVRDGTRVLRFGDADSPITVPVE